MGKKRTHYESINRIVYKTLAIDVADVNYDLFKNGLLDSLSLINLMISIEETFGITITPGELNYEDFRSVHSLSLLVQRHMRPV